MDQITDRVLNNKNEQEKLKGRYLLADSCVEVRSLHQYVHDYCADYACHRCKRHRNNDCDGQPDILVSISQDDIDYERKKSAMGDQKAGLPVQPFSDRYLETLAVYRQIAEEMPAFDTILIHGSAVAVDGKGYLFIAKSGTGKSTHARLWRVLLKDRVVMINDDKPLLRLVTSESLPSGADSSGIHKKADEADVGVHHLDRKDAAAMIYGTPWSGKHNLNTNIAVPLKAVCLLGRGEKNRIEEISKKEAFSSLLQQIYRPAGAEAMIKTMKLIDRLKVNYYRLSCNMDIEAACLSYGIMSGENQHDI